MEKKLDGNYVDQKREGKRENAEAEEKMNVKLKVKKLRKVAETKDKLE